MASNSRNKAGPRKSSAPRQPNLAVNSANGHGIRRNPGFPSLADRNPQKPSDIRTDSGERINETVTRTIPQYRQSASSYPGLQPKVSSNSHQPVPVAEEEPLPASAQSGSKWSSDKAKPVQPTSKWASFNAEQDENEEEDEGASLW